MAAPVVTEVAAQQVAQQKIQDEALQKQGPSKFDNVLTDKADSAQQVKGAEEVQRAQEVHATSDVERVTAVARAGETELQKVRAIKVQALESAVKTQDPSPDSRVVGGIIESLGSIEKGQGMMENLIQMATSGKEFSNSELLGLQAGMYKYTQELDLTSKVVEKATTGLKDTLKTQV